VAGVYKDTWRPLNTQPHPEVPSPDSGRPVTQLPKSRHPTPEVPPPNSGSPHHTRKSRHPTPEVLTTSGSPVTQLPKSRHPTPEVPSPNSGSPVTQLRKSRHPTPEDPPPNFGSPATHIRKSRPSTPEVLTTLFSTFYAIHLLWLCYERCSVPGCHGISINDKETVHSTSVPRPSTQASIHPDRTPYTNATHQRHRSRGIDGASTWRNHGSLLSAGWQILPGG
jgi:hypothetical protein